MPVRTFNQVSYDDIYISIVFRKVSYTPYPIWTADRHWPGKTNTLLLFYTPPESCHYICIVIYRETERERESTHTHLNPYPLGRIRRGMFLYSICWLRCALDFLKIGYCFGLAQKGSAGLGGEASSHVAQSVIYVICWFHFCIGFPTNRILCCVGSKWACRGLVDHMEGIAAGEGARERCTVARNHCSGLLGAHVRSKSQLRLVLEPTRLGPLAADMSLYVI